MNRRNLLKLSGQAAVGIVAARLALGSSLSGVSSERVATAKRMIAESSSWWEQVRDRENGKNPALVYFGDGQGLEISRDNGQRWTIQPRELTKAELSEFNGYIQTISPYCGTTIGAPAFEGGEREYNIRAWIKNGRKAGWNMSIEGVKPRFNER